MPEIVKKYYKLKDLWIDLKKLPNSRKYLAGGTDLLISLKYGSDDSFIYLDISDIEELKIIKENKKDIFIGSAVKISDLEKNDLIKKYAPGLIEMIPFYASPSIRNMATLGGNYANASPSADGICVLSSINAKVLLNLKNKKRILPILSILKGPKKINLKKDEIIEGFIIDKWEHKTIFKKMMARKLFGISKASLCFSYFLKNKILKELNISLASVAPKIIYPKKTIFYLKNKIINEEVIKKACEIIETEINPIDDVRSKSVYRKKIISIFLERTLKEIIK